MPRPTSRTSTWATTPAAETAELKLLLSVRDRLHLAEVMRTLKRSPTVLRVARVKP
jgi:GTP pyrophosphokinase/guanosine-3',5'-bis(diphosphate) 3'-pyrophosphohydrolase